MTETPGSHLHVLDPSGNPIPNKDEQPSMEGTKVELRKMMSDTTAQQYAAALTIGVQLHAWATQYISRMDEYSDIAKNVFIDLVQAAMFMQDGSPRAFDEAVMDNNLREEVVPFVKRTVKKHLKKVRAEQSRVKTDVDSVMKNVEKDMAAKNKTNDDKTSESEISE